MSHIWINRTKGDDSKSGLSPEEAIKTMERLDEVLDEVEERDKEEDNDGEQERIKKKGSTEG